MCSSPMTTSAACRGDDPGQEPMPVAAAKTLTRPTVFDDRSDPLISKPGRGSRHARIGQTRCWSWCAAAMLAAGCTQTVDGRAMRAAPGIDDDSLSPVDVETLMLDQAQMRAITGAGDDLTIIPSMDGKFPVDIDQLAETRAAAVSVDLRRDPDVRPRRRGIPQDDVSESARRRADLRGRRGLPGRRYRSARVRRSGRSGRRLRLDGVRPDVRR